MKTNKTKLDLYLITESRKLIKADAIITTSLNILIRLLLLMQNASMRF